MNNKFENGRKTKILTMNDMPQEKKIKRGKNTEYPALEDAFNTWVTNKCQYRFILI